jgi:hypothetical protein
MKYKVDGWNNFCRVFELPDMFPSEFCFGGGHPVTFKIIDWFNPIPDVGQPAVSKEIWKEEVGEIEVKEVIHDEIVAKLVPFLQKKQYITEDKKYLVMCDFGASFTFEKEGEK